MLFLILASVLWSLSFGLIKRTLSGVDADLTAFLRLAIAFLVFAPFLRPGCVRGAMRVRLAMIGAVQYGVMYTLYIRAYACLDAHEVALLTVLTPILVVVCDDLVERQFSRTSFLAAGLAAAGAGYLVAGPDLTWPRLRGVGVLQLSNLCFAVGQVAYRRIRLPGRGVEPTSASDLAAFAWLYAGAALTAGTAWAVTGGMGGMDELTSRQWLAILYLGVLPSGVGFFLWNVGARRVPAGVLAVMNNLKVPLAVALAFACFGERGHLARLLPACTALAVALWAAHGPRVNRQSPSRSD